MTYWHLDATLLSIVKEQYQVAMNLGMYEWINSDSNTENENEPAMKIWVRKDLTKVAVDCSIWWLLNSKYYLQSTAYFNRLMCATPPIAHA